MSRAHLCLQSRRDVARLQSQLMQLETEVSEQQRINDALDTAALDALLESESRCRSILLDADATYRSTLEDLFVDTQVSATLVALQEDATSVLEAHGAAFAAPVVAEVSAADARAAAEDARKTAELQLVFQEQEQMMLAASSAAAASAGLSGNNSPMRNNSAQSPFKERSSQQQQDSPDKRKKSPSRKAAFFGNNRAGAGGGFFDSLLKDIGWSNDDDANNNNNNSSNNPQSNQPPAQQQQSASSPKPPPIPMMYATMDNPNQLGEQLTDMLNPMWYPARCLSAAVRGYFGGRVRPQVIELAHSHDEENFSNVAAQAVGSFVANTSDFVRAAGGMAGRAFTSIIPFLNNKDRQQQQQQGRSDSPARTPAPAAATSTRAQPCVVEPLWLHMENNQVVAGAVEQSVLHPFPAFDEHNSDESLRTMYREMARRSAAERARREGTSAAVPIVDNTAHGGFSVNDSRRIYSGASPVRSGGGGGANQQQQQSQHHHHHHHHHARYQSTGGGSQQQQQGLNSGPASPARSNNVLLHSRQCRADEYRIAFFATALFRRVHAALDFDVKELVEQAAFDHGIHKWRFAHSPGKSDSTFFFFGHFVAKSLKESEFKFMHERFLPCYVDHVESNKYTLLPHFLALLSIVDNSRGKSTLQRFVIMNNVFPTRRVIERMYDLKGSTVNRDGLAGDITRTSFGAVLLKDNDLPPKLMLLGPVRSKLLINQLRCDTDFLCALSILDYSLLIGVRSERIQVGAHGVLKTRGDKEDGDGSCFRSWDGGMPSLPIFDDGNDMTSARIETFYVGLIDVLQNYSPAKRFEATAKGLFFSGNASVIPPDQFAERLVDLVMRISD